MLLQIIKTLVLGALFLSPFFLQAAQTITAAVADPASIPVGISTLVSITAQILPDPTLITGSINLVRYDATGQALSTLGLMYDDGTHGDQDSGDNVFTIQLELSQSVPSELLFRVSAAYKGKLTRVLSPVITVSVVPLPSTVDIRAITATNQQASNLFASLSGTSGLDAARTGLLNWLSQQPTVLSEGLSSDGQTVWIQYMNGLYGVAFGNPVGTWGAPTSNKGLVGSPISDKAEPELESVYSKWASSGVIVPDPILQDPVFGIETFKTLYKYGAISLATDGSMFKNTEVLVTGTSGPIDNTSPYVSDWVAGRVVIDIGNKWNITPSFITTYNLSFPGSILFLSVCDSLNNTNLSQAFIQKGAQAVFGWKNPVSVTFAKKTKDALIAQMLDNQGTAGYALQSVPQVDTDSGHGTPPAVLTFDGVHEATLVPRPSFTISFGDQLATDGQTLNISLPAGTNLVAVSVTSTTGGDLSLDGSPLFSIVPAGDHSFQVGPGTHSLALALKGVTVQGTIIVSEPSRPTAAFTLSANGQNVTNAAGQLNLAGAQFNVTFDASLSAATSGATVNDWQWMLNNSLVSTTSIFAMTLDAGTYAVSLVVSDTLGGQSTPVDTKIIIAESPLFQFDFTGTVISRFVQGMADPGIGQIGDPISGSVSYVPPTSSGVTSGGGVALTVTQYDGVVATMSFSVDGVQFNSSLPANQTYAAVSNNGLVQFSFDPVLSSTAPFNTANSSNRHSVDITLGSGATTPTSLNFPTIITPSIYPTFNGQFTYSDDLGSIFVISFAGSWTPR